MIFEEIYFSRHILLTGQISLADYLKDSFKKRRHMKNFQTLFQKYSSGGVPWKSFFLEISQNSQENTCANVSFLKKLQALVFLAQVFSCEFCDISNITPFATEHLRWLLQNTIFWGRYANPIVNSLIMLPFASCYLTNK